MLLIPSLVQAQMVSDAEKRSSLIDLIARELHNRNPDILEALNAEQKRLIIADSIGWIKKSQADSGQFRYEYHPYADKYIDDDNIVRQAGTVFSLAMTASRDLDRAHDLKPTITKSIDYLESLSETGEFNGREFRCVIDRELGDSCKLGASALTLVTLMESFKAYPELETEYRQLANDYKEYLLAMRNQGAGFKGYFDPNDGALQSSRESSFFNGEALLALTLYQQYQPESVIEDTLLEVFDYLYTTADRDPGLYLWSMASVNLLDQMYDDPRYLSYAQRYVSERLLTAESKRRRGGNYCAYTEGLASANVLFNRHLSDSVTEMYNVVLQRALSKNAALQISAEDRVRAVIDPNDGLVFKVIKNVELAEGGFLTAQDELVERIDFTQHCLSAFVIDVVDVHEVSL